MFDLIKADLRRHEGGWKNRAVWVLVVYRFGQWSLRRRFPPWRWLTSKLYGLMALLQECVTDVHINRHVRMGSGFHIIHAATIFIHPDVVIGDRCGVMHNVTIGTNMTADVPVIGNDVFIGCGASILGKVKVGDDARIAANTLVINDVPAGHFAVGVPAKMYKRPNWRKPGPAAAGAAADASPAVTSNAASASSTGTAAAVPPGA